MVRLALPFLLLVLVPLSVVVDGLFVPGRTRTTATITTTFSWLVPPTLQQQQGQQRSYQQRKSTYYHNPQQEPLQPQLFKRSVRCPILFSTNGNNDEGSSLSSSSSSTRTAAATTTTTTKSTTILGQPICEYHQIPVATTPDDNNDDNNNNNAGPPRQIITVHDLTPLIQQHLKNSGMVEGVIHVMSRHTTTALTINEYESRLARDVATVLMKLVPPDERSMIMTTTTTTQSNNNNNNNTSKNGIRYQHNDIEQ